MKKTTIGILAVLLISFASALYLPFLFEHREIQQTQMMSDVPDILDNVNEIINNVYWTEYWLNYEPVKKHRGGGGGSSSPVIEEEPEPEPKVLGDADGDGVITNNDISALSDMLVKCLTQNINCDKDILDLDGSGEINNNDAGYFEEFMINALGGE